MIVVDLTPVPAEVLNPVLQISQKVTISLKLALVFGGLSFSLLHYVMYLEVVLHFI